MIQFNKFDASADDEEEDLRILVIIGMKLIVDNPFENSVK